MHDGHVTDEFLYLVQIFFPLLRFRVPNGDEVDSYLQLSQKTFLLYCDFSSEETTSFGMLIAGQVHVCLYACWKPAPINLELPLEFHGNLDLKCGVSLFNPH